ncbi:MAG: AMP-binding protein [Pseudomonadota bacterium]|nr:AMP-binding protein [Pseudomonadota bacterium]
MSAVFNPMHLQAALLDVVAASHAPPSLIGQRQQQRVLRLLEAARAAPVYRERLGSGLLRLSDLARMAPVTRQELMARFDDWVTDPALKLHELRDFVAEPARAAEPWLDRYVVWESSGTSGQPGIFVQDAQAMAVYDALEAVRHRPPARGGRGLLGLFAAFDVMGVSDRTALVAATGGHFASVVSFERLRRINPWLGKAARSFSLLQPLDELVAALNDFQPTVLATYPTAAALLADEAEAGRLRIAPRCVLTGGETLGQAVRQRLTRVFDAPVRNSYGTSECLAMAWECGRGHLHLNEDWVLLEPVDEKQRPLPTGVRSHGVLLTNLANLVQPLIRYDLGDQITFTGQRCGCGSALPVIEVQGRRDDVLRVPSQRKGQKVSLLPLALCTVVEEEGGVFDFQLQQKGPGTLVLRLPQQGEAAEAALARCRDALQHFAQSQGAAPIQVLGELGCKVPRGRSGKACRVVR